MHYKILQLLQPLVGLILWVVIFVVIRFVVNKTFSIDFKLKRADGVSIEELLDELDVLYSVTEKSNYLNIRTTKIDDSITNGTILLKSQEIDEYIHYKLIYQRKIKFSGYAVIILSLCLFYIGVLIPFIIIQETKKEAINELDRIKYIVKSIKK